MAMRLYHVARAEEARASNAASAAEPDQDANALHDRLRRDLRIDALHDLAFRSREVFEANREYAVGDRWRDSCAMVPTAGGAPSLVSDILAGWKQWAAAGGASGTDEAEALAYGIRSDLLGAADRLPATLEALPVKALALAWIMYPDLWAAGQSRNDYATDGRLALDIHQAAVSAEASAIHPDADLIALGLELDAAREHEAEVDADCDARADAATAAMPERPACLTFRESDHPFGLIRNSIHSSAMDGLAVEHDDIAWMRRGPRKHQVLRDPLPGEHGWRDYGGKVPEMQVWPEAQARADEILTAWDAWRAARDAVDRAHGVYEAEARCDESGKEITAILERIATLPAHTAEGLRIKLRAIRHGVVDASDDTATCRVFRSLLRDAGAPEVKIAAEA